MRRMPLAAALVLLSAALVLGVFRQEDLSKKSIGN